MHILITGGLGFIGRALADRLVQHSHRITLLDLPGRATGVTDLDPAIGIIECDLLDIDDWSHVLGDVDVVVHGAGVHQVDQFVNDPVRANEVNVRGANLVFAAAAAAGVRRIVFLSSAKVYGQTDGTPSNEADLVAPAEPYALTKVTGEYYLDHYAREYPIETVTIRPFSVYGPGQDVHTGYIGMLLEALRHDRPVFLPGRPDFTRDFVHIDTTVDICRAAVEDDDPPRVLNAGSGEPITLAELVDLFSTIARRPIAAEYVTARAETLAHTAADQTAADEFAKPVRRDLESGITATLRSYEESPLTEATPVALVLAAGKGSRFGADRPKQLLELHGKPVLWYALDQHLGLGHHVVLVVSESVEADVRAIIERHFPGAPIDVVRGGATRRESVLAGIAAIPDATPADAPVILRNAASPNTPTSLLDACTRGVRIHAGTQAYIPSDKTTFVHADGNLDWLLARDATGFTVDPTVYRRSLMEQIGREMATGDSGETTLDIARRLRADIAIIESPASNVKLTRAEDLDVVAAFMAAATPTPD